jgi:hypothetical protein
MNGPRWWFFGTHPKSGAVTILAEAHPKLGESHARVLGHLLADDTKLRLQIHSPKGKEPLSNPRLPSGDHVAYPRWTIYEPAAGYLVATLSGLLSAAQAKKAAKNLATWLGFPVAIVEEFRGAKANPGTPDPVAGERWARKGGGSAANVTDYARPMVYFTSGGDRGSMIVEDFKAKFNRPGRTANPKRRNPIGPPAAHESRVGRRVQLHAATSEWMQGDRYGVIIGYGRARDYSNRTTGEITKERPVKVKLDKSGRIRAFHPENLFEIESNPGGPRIVYNRLLGGWYVVTGPHQTPLNGRFDSKAEAQAWLGRKNPRPGKMRVDDYNALRAAIEGQLAKWPADAHSQYEAAGLSPRRFRWDLLHASKFPIMPLYAYLNDANVDTALRSILGHGPERETGRKANRRGPDDWDVQSDNHIQLGTFYDLTKAQAETKAGTLARKHGLSYVLLLSRSSGKIYEVGINPRRPSTAASPDVCRRAPASGGRRVTNPKGRNPGVAPAAVRAYIKSIRNHAKQDYASSYALHLLRGDPAPDTDDQIRDGSPAYPGLSYMAAQAVRMRLTDLIGQPNPCSRRRHNPGCPCDPRCCGATGDVCECRCGGAYHKSGGGGNIHLTHRNPRGGKIAVGDRVQYRAEFLRSTGMYTGDVPRAKGIVTALTPFGGAGNALATIEWDIPGIPERVLTPNLKRVGDYEPNPRELSRVRQHGTRVTATGTPAARMAALRQIVAESQYAKIDGTMVDLYTASAIVQIYDALNEANRAKFASFPVGMMAKVAFKLMQPKTNPRARTWIVIDAGGRQFWQGEATDEGEALFMAERSAAGQADPPDPWLALQSNPSWRLSGTLEEVPDAAPVVRRRGPGRPRKAVLAPVELAAELDPVPFEVPAEAPGRELQAGDRVTVPYSGRASYFGRAAKHTRESGIFEGYTYENDQRLAFVRVNRGHTVETHAFPVDQVRLHGKSFAAQAAAGRAGRPAKLARLTWKAHGSLAKAEAMLEKATAEHAATEAVAMELYPQHEAQPGRPRGRTEAASRDYLNARAKLRRLTERVELLGSVVRSLGGGQEYGQATGTDPWASNRRRYSNQRRHNGPLKNARTVRGAMRKRNPRGSERERAVRTFKMWHEFAPHKITKMKGPDRLIPRTLVKLGDIRSIDYISDKYEGRPVTYTHKTDRPRPVLATDPDGQNLHIIGGRVKITGDGLIH